jgi:hypothetical protein
MAFGFLATFPSLLGTCTERTVGELSQLMAGKQVEPVEVFLIDVEVGLLPGKFFWDKRFGY